MHTIQYVEHDPRSARQFSTEARITSDCFDIRIENARWSRPGTAMIEAKQDCLLRLLLSSPTHGALQFSNNTGRFLRQGCHFKPLGPALFIPRETAFQFNHGMTDHKALICLFNPDALSPMSGIPWSGDGCVKDSMLNLDTPYLTSVLHRLARECVTPGFASDLQVECLLTAMALDLQKEYIGHQRPESSSPHKLSTAQVQCIREMFEAGPGIDCSLGALASACKMPARKLSQQFKNTTGFTLRQYAAQTRIRQAKSLLSNPNVLIKQVAYQTGFQTPASFSAAFRKEVGVTPEIFRSSV